LTGSDVAAVAVTSALRQLRGLFRKPRDLFVGKLSQRHLHRSAATVDRDATLASDDRPFRSGVPDRLLDTFSSGVQTKVFVGKPEEMA
jgi:hypothetical protein